MAITLATRSPRSLETALARSNPIPTPLTKSGTTIQLKDDAKSAILIRTPEENTIVLDDDAQTIQIADQHGNAMTLSKDGIVIKSAKDVKIEASGGLEIKTSKDTKVNARGKVEIKGSVVDVK